MEKLVLHEAGELAKFRDVAPEKIYLVHRAQDPPDLTLPRTNRHEGFARRLRILKSAIDQMQPAADPLGQLRAELELALLHVLKQAHHPHGILRENLRLIGVKSAADHAKSVE